MPTVCEPGEVVVVRDVWRGRVWSLNPAILVRDDDDGVVEFMPAGTRGLSSTSRGIPERDGLSRGERQLRSMETGVWGMKAVEAKDDGLNFVSTDSWARIALLWRGGFKDFIGWYVNFQWPLARTRVGFDTMDLILDLRVDRDYTWRWKDREDFDAALTRGILVPEVRDAVEGEASRVRELIDMRSGPFAPEWRAWRPDAAWSKPSLPRSVRERYAADLVAD